MSAEKKLKQKASLPLNDRLWTQEEAMDFLQISKATFYRLLASEKLPSLKVGNKNRFIPEQLMAWAKKKTAS